LIKRPNLKIHGIEEGTQKQTKGIRKILSEITVENLKLLGKILTSNSGSIENSK
jgi:hypothetical protein